MTLAQQTFAEWEMRHARRQDPETSKIAARRATKVCSEHLRRMLEAMMAGGSRDWTPHELSAACGLSPLQVSRRIHDAYEDGRIVESGNARPTPSGRPARCWRLA